MPLDSAKTFIEKIKTDEAFRNRVMAIENVEGLRQFMSSKGYDIIQEDISQVWKELHQTQFEVGAGKVGGRSRRNVKKKAKWVCCWGGIAGE